MKPEISGARFMVALHAAKGNSISPRRALAQAATARTPAASRSPRGALRAPCPVRRERGIRPGERLALGVDPLLRMLMQVGKERRGRMIEHARIRRIGKRARGVFLKPCGERIARALDRAVLLDDAVLGGHAGAAQ